MLTEKQREYRKKYYQANKEKLLEQDKIHGKAYRKKHKDKKKVSGQKYYEQNKEKVLKQSKDYYKTNKEVVQKKHKIYREENKEAIKNKWHKRYLKHTYNLPIEEYTNMLNAQNNCCKICNLPPKNKRLSVDHCHVTGDVRGLLCSSCNQALGMFKDKIDLLENAIIYLRDHKGI